jgi:hypothetical protein
VGTPSGSLNHICLAGLSICPQVNLYKNSFLLTTRNKILVQARKWVISALAKVDCPPECRRDSTTHRGPLVAKHARYTLSFRLLLSLKLAQKMKSYLINPSPSANPAADVFSVCVETVSKKMSRYNLTCMYTKRLYFAAATFV